MRKVIELRKNLIDNQENIDNMNRNEDLGGRSMNEIEDKMIKIFSGFKDN